MSMGFFSLVLATVGSSYLSMRFFCYVSIVIMVTTALMPLSMSADPADVSSSCDELLAELNVQRGNDDSMETHEMLLRLETFLNSLNNREGLGFVAGGNVLDKRRLGRIIGGVFGLFATVVPFRPVATIVPFWPVPGSFVTNNQSSSSQRSSQHG